MIPWKLIDRAEVPGGGGELCLYKRGSELSIRVDGRELMNNRVHGSEETMAEYACMRIIHCARPVVLIGGLGMGYTLAAALERLGPQSRVIVAELVPAVVKWNRGSLADLAGNPLRDGRVTVRETDVARILEEEGQAYDAIVLDVDNGPVGLTREGNNWLYTRPGLEAAFRALRPGGVFAVWSAGPDRTFTARLRRVGFAVEEVRTRARGRKGGGWHTIWMATRRV